MIAQKLTQMEEMHDRIRQHAKEHRYEDALALCSASIEMVLALSNATAKPDETDRLRLKHLFKRHTEMVTQLEVELQLARAAVQARRIAIDAYARY